MLKGLGKSLQQLVFYIMNVKNIYWKSENNVKIKKYYFKIKKGDY